jgi:hypothetical protein
MKPSHCIGKCEYAQRLGISRSTLSRWLNHRYLAQLQPLGYTPTQRVLTPAQVCKLNELLVEVDDE